MTHCSSLVLGLALLAPLAQAQVVSPVEAPPELVRPLDLRAGTVQDLVLPTVPGTPFQVEVVLGGARRTLALRPHDVRSPDFKLLVDDGKSLRQVPTPPSVTYRGAIAGMPDTLVAASLIDGQLAAAVHTADQTWWIMPATDAMPGLPRSAHVVARHTDYVRPGRCGVSQQPAALAPGNPVAPPSGGALKVAEIAIDVTNPGYQKMGSTTTGVNNRVTSVMNVVDNIYTRDVQITKTVVTIIIRTTRVYTATGTNLLGQVSSRWRQFHGSIQRDLVHAFGGNPPGGILGIANLGVVCSNNNGTAVSWWVGSINGHSDLVAHEMGHNWNASHCDGANPCYTMCCCCPLNNLKFAPVSINRITNFKNSRTCLSNPSPPLLSSVTPSSVTSYQPGAVTLTGTDLDGIDTLTVGGTSVSFNVQSPTSITFTPPSPFEIKTHAVVALAGGVPSNAVNLTVTGNHPSVFQTTPFQIRTFPAGYDIHTDRNWLATLFLSSSNTPSALPAVVTMEIGANFTSLFNVATLTADVTGSASLQITWPAALPPQAVYGEFITYTLSSGLPLETSNALAVTIL